MVISLAIDKEYAGFYITRSKKVYAICLGYIAIRLYLFSESNLHKAITILGRKK